MALLILDGSGPGVRASLPGLAARRVLRAGELAAATASLLAEAAIAPASLEAIVAMVGPGSFTGLRAALALAHGLAAGAGVALVAVGGGEAFAHALPGRPLLAVFAGGRAGRFVLQQIGADGTIGAPFACDSARLRTQPLAPGVVLVGPAAGDAGALLDAAGADATPPSLAAPPDAAITAAARARLAGRLAPRPATPIYADDLFGRAG